MLVRSKLWYLENLNFRQILTLEERRKIAGTAVMQHVPKKEVLYFSNQTSDCVYILIEGKVKIYRQTPDGREISLNILSPGELFGELSIAGQQEREEVAEVMEDAVLCLIKLEDMPSLNAEILKRLGARVKKIKSRLESLICKNAEERIRYLLKEIALEHGRIIGGDLTTVLYILGIKGGCSKFL